MKPVDRQDAECTQAAARAGQCFLSCHCNLSLGGCWYSSACMEDAATMPGGIVVSWQQPCSEPAEPPVLHLGCSQVAEN